MDINLKRREILKQVERGEIAIEDASVLLAALENSSQLALPQDNPGESAPDQDRSGEEPREAQPEKASAPGCWRVVWFLPLVTGVILTCFSAWWMAQGWQKQPFGWAFWLSWLPFLIGIALTVVGWMLETAPWLILDVRSKAKAGEHRSGFILAMPAPFGLLSWLLRTFPALVPENVKQQGITEMMEAVNESLKNGDPVMIDVNDEDDGEKERVLIYIGKR